jgi:hypothetical protein
MLPFIFQFIRKGVEKMLKLFYSILCFISSLQLCYSQNIIWEEELELDMCLSNYSFYNNLIIDSDNNIVSIIENHLSDYNSYFLKHSENGELLEKKNLYNPSMFDTTGLRIPLAVYQNNNYFKIFGGTTSFSPALIPGKKLLPLIINTDEYGDTVSVINPYDINKETNYTDYGIVFNDINANTVASGNLFFNVYVNKYVKISENHSLINHHIVISCYDTSGKMIWRKGYDSLGSGGRYYVFKNIKPSVNGNIMVLCHEYNMDGIDWMYTGLKFIEIDKKGDVVKRINLSHEKYHFYPIEVIKSNNDNYCFLNQYLNSNDNDYFLWLVNSKGEIIGSSDIPNKGIKTYYEKLKASNDGGIILLAGILIDRKNTDTPLDDLEKLYMVKMNMDFELIWEYESDTGLLYNNGYIDLEYISENEFIVTYYKNKYFYCIAKFGDSCVGADIIDEKRNILSVYPNPISNSQNFNIRISLENSAYIKIELINSLGLKVSEILKGYKESGEHTFQYTYDFPLSSGTYWTTMTINGVERISVPFVILK